MTKTTQLLIAAATIIGLLLIMIDTEQQAQLIMPTPTAFQSGYAKCVDDWPMDEYYMDMCLHVWEDYIPH